ncbi:uncharacterized protein OCT59_012289 [Rhizophagus irregularis]|uniref:F-box domain-containing protein n=4 Tax=Rhizophagus irregularis TaxID=588596 RepID=A0A015KAK0_RHIIW|nr:hypothetical protein RirG_031610 [Rhizophagus irregularis DAOM 197198w]UZO01185.1 hypothetical protein OCT59_012289 [Rhizophagus irregularis]GBC40193.1 hypothetical protein GLOIN_2v1784270 [Rhizophagus irregularis DAOM 181602=DAOM 197198]
MSCSKIFSGELPELTYDILKYFKNDFSTLHSCILVNRLWCRLAIPLLWENPFSKPTGNYKFIEICLDNLNGDLKTELNEYRIEDNLFPSNTLFNYPSFIRYLNTHTIFYSIYKWSEIAKKTLKPEKRNLYEVKNFQKLIQILFFKLIIDNEANLHTLKIELISSTWNSHFNNLLELILQNPNFIIHNVKNLTFYTRIHNDSTSDNTYMIAKNLILQLINLHQNLKNISLSFDINFLSYKSLLLTKDYNCSNTLNTITLCHVNFKDIINLDKIFDQLKVLESVHLIYCYSLNNSFIQQIINLNRPFKLKSLIIDSRSQIDDSSFQLLLRKCGGYLENFGSKFGVQSEILHESIIKYCKNIKSFYLSEFKDQIIYLLLDLIENMKQSLNYLTIIVSNCENYIECSSIILQNLGQVLPFKLEYLDLVLHIKMSDFEVFLKNSQDTFIKKLLINNFNDLKGQDILSYIKEYIMKKKRAKYLAFMYSYESTSDDEDIENYKELASMKDEVEEFKLYGIKLLSYYGSLISFYEFTRD